MIISICLAFVVYKNDPSTLLLELGSVTTLTFQYGLVSKVSSEIEDSYKGIAIALYSSKWYLLPTSDRKTMLRIMMMAQRPKTIKVGIFGKCNLERFSQVRLREKRIRKKSVNDLLFSFRRHVLHTKVV